MALVNARTRKNEARYESVREREIDCLPAGILRSHMCSGIADAETRRKTR